MYGQNIIIVLLVFYSNELMGFIFVCRKEHTRIFIISFLYLCDLLRPKTYSTDVETSGNCVVTDECNRQLFLRIIRH